MSPDRRGGRTVDVVIGLLLAITVLGSYVGDRVSSLHRDPMGETAPDGGYSPPGREGFLSQDGRRFTLDGRVVPLVGMNVYNAASAGNCWHDMRNTFPSTLQTLERESGGGLDVVRVWFFQSLATVRGERDWTQLDRVLATARAAGFRVIPVLTDQWGACEDGRYKSLAWYESGYTEATPDAAQSYRDWVSEVVGRYRDDQTIAMWSLVNEAEAAQSESGACSASAHEALRAFTEDMAAVVKSIDENHLLGLGTIGEGQCGAVAEEYVALHRSALIDVCEYHDYGEPWTPVPGDEANGLATRTAQCAQLGKAMLVGEVGIDPSTVGGLDRRAQLVLAKLLAQRSAGVGGFLAWGWVTPGQVAGDPFGIGPGDPLLGALGTRA